MKKLIFLSMALALALIARSQTVDLKLNLENGKEYKQVTTAKSTSEFEVEGQKMKNVMTDVSEIRIDRKSGWIIDARINQEVSGEATIAANPDMPGGMSLPMKGTTELTITDK